MSLFYGLEVKDIQVKDVPTEDKDVVNKKYVDDQILLVKRPFSGFLQATLTGNTYATDSSLHNGWPKGRMINTGSFRFVVDGLLIDYDNPISLKYNFKIKILVFCDNLTRNDYYLDLYNDLNSNLVPISISLSNRVGNCFTRNDGSSPTIDIQIKNKKAICVLLQIKDEGGMTGNEVMLNYTIEY